MTIRWDAPLARGVAHELDGRLTGARLRGLVLDADTREARLIFRGVQLLWRLHPERGVVRLLNEEPGTEPALPLRGRLRRVHTPPDERIVRLVFLPERRTQRAVDVVVELLGNQWNLLVVDAASGTVRHVLRTRERGRVLRVGQPYTPPPPSRRVGRDGDLSPEEWEALLVALPATSPESELVRRVAWTSPLNAPSLISLPVAESYALWRRLAGREEPAPTLLETSRGLQPYPAPLPHLPGRPATSLLDAFTEADVGGRDADTAGGVPEALLRRAEAVLDQARRRHTRLVAELDATPDPEALRSTGHLLLAHLHAVPSGAPWVELTDFDGTRRRVELDPTLPPARQAERYFQEAARAERARARLPGLIRAAAAEVARLERCLAQAREGGLSPEGLVAELPPASPSSPQGGAPEESLPYRSYRSSGGLEIRVGRGSRHNDELTFRHASPDDIWLHARHAAGAHVILRWGRRENPPARDLEEAAILAALHSKARGSGTVPVDWTRRKYVRKPRKAPPGAVVPDRVKTLFVTPDPRLPERLSPSR